MILIHRRDLPTTGCVQQLDSLVFRTCEIAVERGGGNSFEKRRGEIEIDFCATSSEGITGLGSTLERVVSLRYISYIHCVLAVSSFFLLF